MNKFVAGILIFFGFTLVSQTTFAQAQGISFQAVIKKPDGSLPTVSGLTVKLQILDPIDKCILREEEHLGKNISEGYLNLVIGDPAAIVPSGRNPSPVLSLSQAMDNKTTRSGLKCVDANDSVTDTNHTYNPSQVDRRLVRIRLTVDGQELFAEFNMRGVAFAGNSEMLNSKKDSDFVNINGAKNVTQANMESIFERFTKLDGILNNSNAAGDGLGVNISGNAATATNVSGTVAIANGGTGATSASAARTNLGLGPLATMSPTGTASATTYLRGDGTWQTVSGGGSVTSVAGKTGVVTLQAADVTDFDTAADARITAQKGFINGLASLNGTGVVPSSQLALVASDIPALSTSKITSGTFSDAFLASLSIDKLLNGAGKYFNYKPANTACADGEVLKYDSTLNAAAGGWKCAVDSGAAGVVTSVGVAMPSIFSVSGGPITTSGTITATLANQTQNLVFSSPDSSTGTPTFRAIVPNDLPIVTLAKGGTGSSTAAGARTNLGLGTLATVSPTGTASATTFLRGDGSWQTVVDGVSSVAGKTGVVTLEAADITDFNTAADARITAQKGANNGLATLNGSGKVPSTQLALTASDIPSLDTAKITTGTFSDSFLASLSIDKLLNGAGKYFNYKPANTACANGEVLKYDSTLNSNTGGWKCATDSGSSGVVTSVDVALPSIFSVSGGPITTSGTITATLASQAQNLVLASPTGASGAPVFRSIAAVDLPTVTIAKGGTNSTAALNNNRVMVSSGSAIVEATAITADRALISNTNGIPVHSAVTNTELGYLSGVTSAIQTQLSAKTSATGWANYSVLRTNGSGAVEAVNTSTSGSILQWSVTGPVFSTASFPTSTVANQLLFSSANNVVGGLTTANDAFLMTNGSGVPSWNVLSADNFVQYALLAGRSGGQTIKGGTASGDNLTLDSTAHATKGKVLINPTGGDVGIGTANPGAKLEVAGGVKLGNDAATCDSSKEGTLKYVSPNLLLCNGTDWKLVQLVTPVANVELLSGTGTGMDVTGPGSPAYGSNVVFTYKNNGTANSAALGIALTSSTNFEITGDTCTGVVLSPTSTCTVTVRPKATAAGSLSSSIIVTW